LESGRHFRHSGSSTSTSDVDVAGSRQ
jgi:hypothetical protein